jgi:hypothetical protein
MGCLAKFVEKGGIDKIAYKGSVDYAQRSHRRGRGFEAP